MDDLNMIISEKHLFPLIEEMLSLGKETRFTVSGNSMFPLLCHQRDSVLLSQCDVKKLRKGDIILFTVMNKQHYVLHRITRVLKNGFVTTGDGNCHRDGFIPFENVVAKVKIVYRKDRIIHVDELKWKMLFRIWMMLFPIRKEMIYLIQKIKLSRLL